MMSLQIALRFITDKKIQSIVIVIGFAIGISTNLFIGNLIPSIKDDLIDRTVNSRPHITIEPEDQNEDYVPDPGSIASVLEGHNKIKSFTSTIEGNVFMQNVVRAFPENIILRGFEDIFIANSIYHFFDDKFVGEPPTGNREIAIGKSLAEKFDISIGFEMQLSFSPFAHSSTYIPVKVTGIYDLGSRDLNELWLVTNSELSKEIYTIDNEVSGFIVQIYNIHAADRIAKKLYNQIGRSDIFISNWEAENESLLNSMRAQAISVAIVQFFILLSVAISIASVLGINVMQKAKQIGIMKSMGLSHRGSANIFLVQGTIYGIIGSMIGFFLALFYIGAFNLFGGPDIVNIRIRAGFTIISILISIAAANIASILPAIRSSRMQVIDIIRRG